MDDLFNLIAGDQPAAKTAPVAAKKTAGRGDPTKEQIFGRNDLADYIKSAEESLPQMVPGSDLHSRTTRDLLAAQKAFSGMSGGQPQATQQTTAQPVQQASSDPLLDLIAGTGATAQATEKTAGAQAKVQPQDIFNRPKTPEASGDIRSAFSPQNITGAQETVRSLIQNPLVAAIGGIKGIFQSIPEAISKGEAPAPIASRIADEFTKKYGYSPTSEQGQKFASVISDVLESSKLPPIIPEIQALASAGGAKPQLAKQFEKRANEIPTGNPLAKTAVTAAEMSPQDIASMQATFAAKRGGLTPSAPNAMGQSIGAAATTDAARFNELMTRASPEVQTAVKAMTDAGHKVDAAGLKTLENHINFEEFGMKATPGEATQNVSLLSDEYNAVKSNPELAARLQERDPKLIEGFNKIKEDFAPEAHATDQPTRSTTVLEGLKEKYQARQENIASKYQELRDANGGEFPVDGKAFADNAIAKLHKDLSYEATPPVLLKALDRFSNGEQMTFEQFERLRTITAAEMRKGGTEGHTASVIRQALEDLPLNGEVSVTLKPLADAARNAAREQKQLMDPKSPKYNAAYTAAASDTRSAAEIAQGVPHPASANFFDKHVVGKGASEMQLRRTLDELAGNQAAIDELKAGTIHEAKAKSGIKDDSGSVSQAALNDFINKQMSGKLDVALGAEGAAKLRRLSDVATKSEHVRKGGYANVSKTAIAQTPSPVAEKLKSAADVATQGALTAAHPVLGFGYGVLKAGLKGKAEAKAIAKAAADQEKINKASVAPGGGITYTPLSQIGKK